MAGGNQWTDREDSVIARSVFLGETVDESHRRVLQVGDAPRTRHSVHKRRSHERVTQIVEGMREDVRKEEEAPSAVVTPKTDPQFKQTPEKLWDRAKIKTTQSIEFNRTRHHAEIGFITSKPIALTFAADQHIAESGPVNIARMEQDATTVRETPGMFAVLGGDGCDNHLKHRAAIINSGSKPGNEWSMYDHYLGLFGTSLAAMISGNHDDWTVDIAGVDMVQRIADRRRIFMAPDYVILKVTLKLLPDEPGQEYVVKIRHQYRYSSSFNQTHALKRMWEMDDHDFDVGVLCHHHEPAMEPFKKHGLWRWAFRPGSYQHVTGYSRRYGFGFGEPTCPTVILAPGMRGMEGFMDVGRASRYLTYLRANWETEKHHWAARVNAEGMEAA